MGEPRAVAGIRDILAMVAARPFSWGWPPHLQRNP
jgi:hypothetical protein